MAPAQKIKQISGTPAFPVSLCDGEVFRSGQPDLHLPTPPLHSSSSSQQDTDQLDENPG